MEKTRGRDRLRRGGNLFLFCLMSGLSVGPWNVHANPEGASVAAGSATLASSGTTLAVTNSNGAIINWQSFSIASNETTKFLQTGASSAVLNRVVGTDLSAIYGTLSSNGRVFLVNPNGILVGAGGMINTAGFVASTLNITDADFQSGNMHFTGTGAGTIQNLGTIKARSGDVYLISKQIDNQGTILANKGVAGLYASDEVYLATGADGEGAVRVSATSFNGGTGINNSGLIQAAQAELKATGNMYAMAINNSGAIRATGTATHNGVVRLIAMGGTTQSTGTLLAKNADGTGGHIETSGAKVAVTGSVHTGVGGDWLIDPSSLEIDQNTADTISSTLNGGTSVTEVTTASGPTLELGAADTDDNNGDILVDGAISWNTGATLTFDSYNDILINASIDGSGGGGKLVLAYGSAGAGAAPNADYHLASGVTITLDAGANLQIGRSGTALDTYTVVNDLGTLASDIAAAPATGHYAMGADYTSTGTITNAAIVTFGGTLAGLGHQITGVQLVDFGPTPPPLGLFGTLTSTGTIRDVNLNGGTVASTLASTVAVGALVGLNQGTIIHSTSNLTVSGTAANPVGGLVGENDGTIISSSASGAVTGQTAGGLVGANGSTITEPPAVISSSSASGTVTGTLYAGGLVGFNAYAATITGSSATGAVGSTVGAAAVGGFVGENHGAISGSSASGSPAGDLVAEVGGFVGVNYATGVITGSSASGDLTTAGTAQALGGFVGDNQGAIHSSHATGAVTATGSGNEVGGFAGTSEGVLDGSYAAGAVSGDGDVGGFVGYNLGTTLSGSHATGAVSGTGYLGGFAGRNDSGSTITTSYATGAVDGAVGTVVAVGGFVGENLGAISDSFATGETTLDDANSYVGGFAGWNAISGDIERSYATGRVVSAIPNTFGGFVGENDGGIADSYSMGALVGIGTGGGFVGENSGTGTIHTSYSIGYTNGYGGFAGVNYNTSIAFSGDYWDMDNSGALYAGSDTDLEGVVGLTRADLQSGTLPGSFGAAWGTAAGAYPYLTWQFTSGPQTVSGTVADLTGAAQAGEALGLGVNGALQGTSSSGADGYYYFAVNGGTIGGGDAVLAFLTSKSGNTIYQAGAGGGNVTGLPVTLNTLTIGAATALANSDVAALAASAYGSLSGSSFIGAGNNLSYDGSTLSVNIGEGRTFVAMGTNDYVLDSNLTASSDVNLIFHDLTTGGSGGGVSVSGENVTFLGDVDTTAQGLTVHGNDITIGASGVTGGTFTGSSFNAIASGDFTLYAGGFTLDSFSATASGGDVEIDSGTFNVGSFTVEGNGQVRIGDGTDPVDINVTGSASFTSDTDFVSLQNTKVVAIGDADVILTGTGQSGYGVNLSGGSSVTVENGILRVNATDDGNFGLAFSDNSAPRGGAPAYFNVTGDGSIEIHADNWVAVSPSNPFHGSGTSTIGFFNTTGDLSIGGNTGSPGEVAGEYDAGFLADQFNAGFSTVNVVSSGHLTVNSGSSITLGSSAHTQNLLLEGDTGLTLDGATLTATHDANITLTGISDTGFAVVLTDGTVASVADGTLTVNAAVQGDGTGLNIARGSGSNSLLQVTGNGGIVVAADLWTTDDAGNPFSGSGNSTLTFQSVNYGIVLNGGPAGAVADGNGNGVYDEGFIQDQFSSGFSTVEVVSSGTLQVNSGSITVDDATLVLDGEAGLTLDNASLVGNDAANITLTGKNDSGYGVVLTDGAQVRVENGTLSVNAPIADETSGLGLQVAKGSGSDSFFVVTGSGTLHVAADGFSNGNAGAAAFQATGTGATLVLTTATSEGTLNLGDPAEQGPGFTVRQGDIGTGFTHYNFGEGTADVVVDNSNAGVPLTLSGDVLIDGVSVTLDGNSSINYTPDGDPTHALTLRGRSGGLAVYGDIDTAGGDLFLSGHSDSAETYAIQIGDGDDYLPTITTEGGSITIADANGAAATATNTSAVSIDGATLDATGTTQGGVITIRGISTASGENYGVTAVEIENGSSLITNHGSTIAINGQVVVTADGAAADSATGVYVSSSTIGNAGSYGGDDAMVISIIGKVGSSGLEVVGDHTTGVSLTDATVNAGAGTVTVNGQVWNTSGISENGVQITSEESVFHIFGQGVTIVGDAWDKLVEGGASNGTGVFISDVTGSTIIAGTGGLSITGHTDWGSTDTDFPSYGVWIDGGVALLDEGGAFTLQGTSVGAGSFDLAFSSEVEGGEPPAVYNPALLVSHGGSLSVTADSIDTSGLSDPTATLLFGDNHSDNTLFSLLGAGDAYQVADSAVSITTTTGATSVAIGKLAIQDAAAGTLGLGDSDGFAREEIHADSATVTIHNDPDDNGLDHNVLLTAQNINVLAGFEINSGATLDARASNSASLSGSLLVDSGATFLMSAGGTATVTGDLDVQGSATVTASHLVVGLTGAVVADGGDVGLVATTDFRNDGGAGAVTSRNGGVFAIAGPRPSAVVLNGITAVTASGGIPGAFPTVNTVYYARGASNRSSTGNSVVDQILNDPTTAAAVVNQITQQTTTAAPTPSTNSNVQGGSPNSGPSTGDVVSTDDSSKKGDGNGNSKSDKIQGKAAATASTTSSSAPPANEQVVGAGAVGAIGAAAGAAAVPPPPALNQALMPAVRNQLNQALQP